MRKILLALTLFSSLCSAQTKLSDKAEISVITCGPGQRELYSAFGHSAFRIQDTTLHMDDVYNYGVFDFNQPNFYLNFARGYSYYKLAVYDYKHFEYQYIYYDRYIHEQKLNLTRAQKQKLFDFLQWNAQPENQFYRYDYFYDNCATKIPDVVVKAFGDSVTFDGSYIKTQYTIRELTDLYLKHQPWGDFGIDICLGLPMDKKLTPYEYMFLPDFVEKGFAHATIKQRNTVVPLVKERIATYESTGEAPKDTVLTPLVVFSFFFILIAIISYRDIKRGKLLQLVDVVLFSVLGLLGVLFLLLWIATDHRAAAKNLNLLWALPTHLIVVFAFIKNPKWLMNYFMAIAILSVLLLLTWPILPQRLHYALIPLVMAVGLRAFTQYYIRKHQTTNLESAETAR
jgi:hypothetical protein